MLFKGHPRGRVLGLVLTTGLLSVVLLGLSGSLAAAGPAHQAGGPGETTFQTKCAACHTIGGGQLVGPDLQGVTERRDPAWLRQMIADPEKLFAAKDPIAQQLLAESNNVKMPALGLSDTEIDALVAFLAQGEAGGATTTAPAAPAAPAGDPAVGRLLFTGEQALTNRGPSCIGCHTVSGLGGLGGGALGPDLTHASARYPGPALSSVLGAIAFPTMSGPFANRPLTPQEQADLVAYLVAADQAPAATTNAAEASAAGAPTVGAPTVGVMTRDAWVFVAIGVAGLLTLTVLLAFFWPRQRQSVSSRLRSQGRRVVN